MSGKNCKLCAGKFGFALGLIWGLGCLLLAWAGLWWQFGVPLVQLLSSVYVGYAPSIIGGLWGLLWGFIDFFIFGLLVAWIYNGCCGACKRSTIE